MQVSTDDKNQLFGFLNKGVGSFFLQNVCQIFFNDLENAIVQSVPEQTDAL